MLHVGEVPQQIVQFLDKDSGELPPDITCLRACLQRMQECSRMSKASLHHPNPTTIYRKKTVTFSGGISSVGRHLETQCCLQFSWETHSLPDWPPAFLSCGERIMLLLSPCLIPQTHRDINTIIFRFKASFQLPGKMRKGTFLSTADTLWLSAA